MTFISITQIPYTATIMAHERMGIYAFISIFEAFGKLGICYLLSWGNIDKLILYSLLLAFVQFFVAICYRVYCITKFPESKICLSFDKSILKNLLSFSGWNIMANMSNTLGIQGVLLLINLFFTSTVAAAQSVAGQVSNAMMLFVNNFRMAINPQIIKLYAVKDYEGSKKLTLDSTVYCFDLILMLGLPAIIIMDKLMHIWLVEVPDYAIAFTQWIIIRQIISTFSASFYTPMIAANKMKINSIASVILGFGEFAIIYAFLKIGFGPMWIQYLGVISAIGFSMIVKPYVLIKQINYSLKEIGICYWICLKVLLLSGVISLALCYFLDDSLMQTLLKAVISGLSVVIASYAFLGKSTRIKLNSFIKSKIDNVKKR